MMLPFHDILHCSQRTLTHASAVRHFLPLLLLTITLLIHTHTTAQPIADLFPSHVNHASFFCYPTLIPMIYYTTTNYNLLPTKHAIYLIAYFLGSKNHSIHLHYNYIEYNHALAVRDFLPLLLFAMTLLLRATLNQLRTFFQRTSIVLTFCVILYLTQWSTVTKHCSKFFFRGRGSGHSFLKYIYSFVSSY